MRVVALTAEYEPTFLACLKDWDRDAEGECHKARWYDIMKCRGLRVSSRVPGGRHVRLGGVC
jgi:hypothetical protein